MKYFVAVPYLLQVCGLFPFSSHVVFGDTSRIRYNRCFIVWTIVGVVIVIAECILGFTADIFMCLRAIPFTVEVMKFITNVGSHLLSVIESWITRERQESIWKMNGKAEKMLNKSDEAMQNACYKKIFYKFTIYLVLTIAIETHYVLSVHNNYDYFMTKVWFVNIISSIVCRIRYLQHVMYTTLLAFWFSNIKDELKELSKVCRGESKISSLSSAPDPQSPVSTSKNKRFTEKITPTTMVAPKTIRKGNGLLCNEGSDSCEEDKLILQRLDVLKEMYNMLFEVSEDLNSCFGIAQLANLLDNFVQLTCNFYWIYILLANNELHNLMEEVLSVLPTIAILILLLSSCEKCLEEVRYIGFYIHEIERDSANYDFDLVVENFALQVLTERFEFNVAGFFSMSFNLLQEMFGAITTYMVILIQFTPSTGTSDEPPPGVNIHDFEESVKKHTTKIT